MVTVAVSEPVLSVESEKPVELIDTVKEPAAEPTEELVEGEDGEPRPKRRKLRRRTANESKREALKSNCAIITWKLAARNHGYFNSLVFKQLPRKDTPDNPSPDYVKIMETREEIDNKYWRLACDATQHNELLERPEKFSGDGKTVTPERKALEKTKEYQTVYKQQCQMLSSLITNLETQQREKTASSWAQASKELGYTEELAKVPKRGTKAFKDLMSDEDWTKKYSQVKDRQRELMGLL